MADSKPIIAVLGGTGDLGGGLAWQFARAGYPVIVGSRTKAKGEKAALELNSRGNNISVRGSDNTTAAATADIVIMTVPFANQIPTLETVREQVQGKIFIDATVPLVPPKITRVQLPPEGSSGIVAQTYLGENVRVVSAFQNIAAKHLQDGDKHLNECDVLVTGNDKDAREQVILLARAIGLTAWHAGAIENSVVAEALTSILIFINKKYKIPGAGIKITGATNI